VEQNSDPVGAMGIQVKRIYDAPATSDGYRVLIDRLWPRGVTKDRAHLDEWARELAPSTELRRWFGHDPSQFEEFRRRYTKELAAHADKLSELRSRARQGNADRRLLGPRHPAQRRRRDRRNSSPAVLGQGSFRNTGPGERPILRGRDPPKDEEAA
jgi:uncharacterized protein YeaO (DUF488 family)